MNKPPTARQRQYLRALAHKLAPLVLLGIAGVTDSVVEATRVALLDHELIKLKFGKAFLGDARTGADELAGKTGAHVCQVIGRVAVLYRARAGAARGKKSIELPTV